MFDTASHFSVEQPQLQQQSLHIKRHEAYISVVEEALQSRPLASLLSHPNDTRVLISSTAPHYARHLDLCHSQQHNDMRSKICSQVEVEFVL